MKKNINFIFDMDGVLVDSEGFWQDSEIELFGEEGVVVDRNYTNQFCGWKLEDILKHYLTDFEQLKQPLEYYKTQLLKRLKEKILKYGCAMEGVVETLNLLRINNIPCAVASSSLYDQISTVLEKLNIKDYFTVIHSAQDEKRGKPFPDIFLTAAQKLSARTEDCFVVEDSINGVRAAKNANMKVIAVPSPAEYNKPEFDIADYKLHSLKDFCTLKLL